MKSLLLRFWQWLGRLLGQDTKASDELRATSDESTAAPPSELVTPNSPLVTPVTLPPPLPPQMDLHTGDAAQYSRWASILTKHEQSFYPTLLKAVAGDYQIMAKVRLRDIVRLENDPPERDRHLGRLSCRHIDFLLCEPLTLKPLLVVELDDKSHDKPFAKDNDRYKNELFINAGMPLLRVPDPQIPPRQLRDKIDEALGN